MVRSELRELAEVFVRRGCAHVVVDERGDFVQGSHRVSGFVGGVPFRHSERWWIAQRLLIAEHESLFLLIDITTVRVVELATQAYERRVAQSALAAASAREMNDALTVIQGRLELLDMFALEDGDAARRHGRIALQHVGRISRALHSLRLVGAGSALRPECAELVGTMSLSCEGLGIEPDRVELEGETSCPLLVRPTSLLAILNTVLGALCGSGHTLKLTSRVHGLFLRISFAGLGIRRAVIEALHLGILPSLIRSAGGVLVPHKTTIVLDLPRSLGDVPALTCEWPLALVGWGRVADACEPLLKDLGLKVIRLGDGRSLRAYLETQRVAAAVSELSLPDESGLGLIAAVRETYPDLSYGSMVVAEDAVSIAPFDVPLVCAPFDAPRLRRGLVRDL